VTVRNAGDTGPLTNVVQVATSNSSSCALLTNRQVRCWGANDDNGQLGNGLPNEDSGLPVAVSGLNGVGVLSNVAGLGMGYDNNCAVLASGQARCWGDGNDGQLGDGGTDESSVPVVVKNPSGTGPLTHVTQISLGGHQGCARLDNGQGRCWGLNDEGEVGDGSTTQRNRPVRVKNASGSGPLTGILSLYAGQDHTCALLSGGQVRCWGDTKYGQVGDGTMIGSTIDRLRPRPVRNGGNTADLSGVLALNANSFHSCAIIAGGQVRCWGYDPYGALGDGTPGTSSLPVKVRLS
jgi:alpha-tubulin suppressor-like RCC1 family protein